MFLRKKIYIDALCHRFIHIYSYKYLTEFKYMEKSF